MLIHEVAEDSRPILLNSSDVSEESGTLVGQDLGGQLGSWLNKRSVWHSDRRVECVEHCYTVGLVEGNEGEFVDEDPSTEADIDLGVESLDFPLLLLSANNPSHNARILLRQLFPMTYVITLNPKLV